MDDSKREITKIARVCARFTALALRGEGLGSSEYDFIHCVRHKPGIHQQEICKALAMDRAAAARMASNLERKGFLRREPDPADGRCKRLLATERAEQVKNSKTDVETRYYEWLLEDLDGQERAAFLATLEKLYWKSKNERRDEYRTLLRREAEACEQAESQSD